MTEADGSEALDPVCTLGWMRIDLAAMAYQAAARCAVLDAMSVGHELRHFGPRTGDVSTPDGRFFEFQLTWRVHDMDQYSARIYAASAYVANALREVGADATPPDMLPGVLMDAVLDMVDDEARAELGLPPESFPKVRIDDDEGEPNASEDEMSAPMHPAELAILLCCTMLANLKPSIDAHAALLIGNWTPHLSDLCAEHIDFERHRAGRKS